MSIDLNTMSLKDLKALQADVVKAIAGFAERQKREAMVELEAKAKELGFTLAELLGASAKKSKPAVKAKYAHPENRSLTWSGRGRQPQWYKDAIAAGKSPDDLAI